MSRADGSAGTGTAGTPLYVWRNDCGNQVVPNAVMSAGFGYEQ